MTHHIQNTKAVAEDYLKKIKSNRQTFEKTTCSWCSKSANQFGPPFDERMFVTIPGKMYAGKQAVAIYCPDCLNDAKRVNDIKRAFVIEKRGEDFMPSHVELYTLDNDDEEEEDIGFAKGERVEGDQVTLEDKVTDELSTGTSKGKEIQEEPKEEEKKKTPSGIFKVFKKDE